MVVCFRVFVRGPVLNGSSGYDTCFFQNRKCFRTFSSGNPVNFQSTENPRSARNSEVRIQVKKEDECRKVILIQNLVNRICKISPSPVKDFHDNAPLPPPPADTGIRKRSVHAGRRNLEKEFYSRISSYASGANSPRSLRSTNEMCPFCSANGISSRRFPEESSANRRIRPCAEFFSPTRTDPVLSR